MPTVVNGIGTWYYGKRRIHRVKSTCSFCNAVGELESYDTTLYVVVFFIPVLPLSKKRVLESCPYCRQHRVMNLKDWERTKNESLDQILEKLRLNPDDRDTILAALGVASFYQDEVLFDKLATALAAHRHDDADIQFQLGAAYAYFARWPEAEVAYRAAQAVADKPETRQQLAWALLKQDRPEEADPYLRHILAERNQDQAGMLYVLVEGYQAQGMHEKALEIMDARDAAFPALAATKAWLGQRKISQKLAHTGKRIKSAYLQESGKTGYQEGSWTSKIPRLIPLLLFFGFLSWYLGAAIYIGQARKIYLVNGLNKAYIIAVNGSPHTLLPGNPMAVRVPEGDIAVEFQDANSKLDPIHCQIQSNFWARPFQSRTYVINPDQMALLIYEKALYAEGAHNNPPSELHLGKDFYTFESVDYNFEPLPPEFNVKKGQTVTKTRVGLGPSLAGQQRIYAALQFVKDASTDHVKRWLEFEPDELVCLKWVLDQMNDQEKLAYLAKGLTARPVRVEWHRDYQNYVRQLYPEKDLVPEYKRLAAEMNGKPEAVYLLARVEEQDEAEKHLRQAAEAPSPSPHALYALGYNAMAAGQFREAVAWADRAVKLAPNHPQIIQGYYAALEAAGSLDRLLDELRLDQQKNGLEYPIVAMQVRALAVKGAKPKAVATIEETLNAVQKGPQAQFASLWRLSLENVLCIFDNDVPGFLKRYAQIPNASPFEPLLLEGKLARVAELLADRKDAQAMFFRELLYLAALKAGNSKLADQQWKLLLPYFTKGDRSMRPVAEMFAGRQPARIDVFRRLPMDPLGKRALLAVAAKRFPAQAKELLDQSRKLDFQGDAITLCLRKIRE